MALASVIGNETLCSWPRGGGWLGDADGWLEGRPCLTAGGGGQGGLLGQEGAQEGQEEDGLGKKNLFCTKMK